MNKTFRVFATCDIGEAINLLRNRDMKSKCIRSRKLSACWSIFDHSRLKTHNL